MVAARTVARALVGIFRSRGWALALGRRRGGGGGQLALPLTRAITLTLLPATFLAVPAGAVALAGPPTPPPAGCLLTGPTARATLRARRPEPALAALEQAPPATVRTVSAERAFLTWPRKVGKLLRAHGRQHSRVVKSRGEVVNFPPEAFVPLTGRGRRRSTEHSSTLLPSVPSCTDQAQGAGLRAARRRLAPVALRKWLTVWLSLTQVQTS